MDNIQFTSLIRRLERVADNQPTAYKLKILGLALLGYGYIFMMVAILLGTNLGLVYAFLVGIHSILLLKLGLGLMVINYLIIKSLWVYIPPPEGIVLSRQQAAPLFELLKQIRRKLRGPKIHTILLTDEFNAAITQNPRLGILGWQKNYLIIGLPLLQALSVEQFTAVLAHEYGHLSGAHGHFGAWIYRIRLTWFRLMDSLESDDSVGAILFYQFFRWYIPFFSAYSFVLARLNEYEADKCAAQVVGSEAAAQALINVEVKARFLEELFWPKLFADADKKPAPSHKPYHILPKLFPTIKPKEAESWLKQALQERTGIDDTHPCLRDRLEALDEKPKVSISTKKTAQVQAASHFLTQKGKELLEQLNQQWIIDIMPRWRERHQYVQTSKQQLKALQEKAQKGPLTIEEQWQQAVWIDEFYGGTKALPYYQAILKGDSQHAEANYAVGRILLESGNKEGIPFWDRAMAQAERYILPCCQYLYHFLQQCGDTKLAKAYRKKAEEHAESEAY